MSKPYQFKAPPQLNKLFPLLLSYPLEIRTSKSSSKYKRLHIDMTAIQSFDSLGLNIFLTNMAKEVRKHGVFEFQIRLPEDENICAKFEKLRVANLLSRLGLIEYSPSMWELNKNMDNDTSPYYEEFDRSKQALLYTTGKHSQADRSSLTFARKKLKEFYEKNPCETINYPQVHHILDEIIKNTIDHSGDDGITALKFEGTKKKGKLHFVHSELGAGISINVRNFLTSSSQQEDQRLAERGSTADFLHWAFLPGHTSKPDSGVNAGLGLAHIYSASKGGGIELYFSDAQSLAYVTDFPDEHSHRLLRKKLYHSHALPCFMYFGETK